MKAMPEQLDKENEEEEACIKLHEEMIAKLTRKMKNRPARSLEKSLESEEGGRRSSKVKLPTKRSTQRRAKNSRMTGLQT